MSKQSNRKNSNARSYTVISGIPLACISLSNRLPLSRGEGGGRVEPARPCSATSRQITPAPTLAATTSPKYIGQHFNHRVYHIWKRYKKKGKGNRSTISIGARERVRCLEAREAGRARMTMSTYCTALHQKDSVECRIVDIVVWSLALLNWFYYGKRLF